MDEKSKVYRGGVQVAVAGIEQRIETMEKTVEKLSDKVDTAQESNHKLELAMASIDGKLSSLVNAVQDISKLAKDSIATVEKLNSVREDVEILFKVRKDMEKKFEDAVKGAEIKLEKALTKRDTIFIGIASTGGTILAGFFIWYVQRIGG